jgi:hypothetical protein
MQVIMQTLLKETRALSRIAGYYRQEQLSEIKRAQAAYDANES